MNGQQSTHRFLRRALFFAAALAAAFLLSCKPPNDVPKETISFQPDGSGFVQFKTNDPQYLDTYWWEYYPAAVLSSVPWTLAASIRKVSGYLGDGLGVIFRVADQNNFYTVLVAWNGWFKVSVISQGNWATIQDWTGSSAINQGLGATNDVAVTETSANNFSVSINGTLVTTFTDSTLAPAGMAGFYASIHNQATERFPESSVDVRFKMTSPVQVP